MLPPSSPPQLSLATITGPTRGLTGLILQTQPTLRLALEPSSPLSTWTARSSLKATTPALPSGLMNGQEPHLPLEITHRGPSSSTWTKYLKAWVRSMVMITSHFSGTGTLPLSTPLMVSNRMLRSTSSTKMQTVIMLYSASSSTSTRTGPRTPSAMANSSFSSSRTLTTAGMTIASAPSQAGSFPLTVCSGGTMVHLPPLPALRASLGTSTAPQPPSLRQASTGFQRSLLQTTTEKSRRSEREPSPSVLSSTLKP